MSEQSELVEVQDRRYGSRKFLVSAYTIVFASVVTLALGWQWHDNADQVMGLLWWWTAVSGGVLTMYGAQNIMAKR